jgi:hypothetical protein
MKCLKWIKSGEAHFFVTPELEKRLLFWHGGNRYRKVFFCFCGKIISWKKSYRGSLLVLIFSFLLCRGEHAGNANRTAVKRLVLCTRRNRFFYCCTD